MSWAVERLSKYICRYIKVWKKNGDWESMLLLEYFSIQVTYYKVLIAMRIFSLFWYCFINTLLYFIGW